MSRGFPLCLLALLLVASSACATTVGPIRGRAVSGHPLEVNVPFAVDAPTDRACASANVRYGNALVPRTTLDVQGRGSRRNLLLTSRAKVTEPTVTVNVRVGCGAKAVARKFVMQVNTPAASVAMVPLPKPVALTRSEPLFPPSLPEAGRPDAQDEKPGTSLGEDLRKARADAAAALAQLDGVRRELAAVLEVERRTGQTLIQADHDVRNARSDASRMRLLLQSVGAALALAAAGLAWFEVQRVLLRRRTATPRPPQEPGLVSGMEMKS
jgi:hypothetical protein